MSLARAEKEFIRVCEKISRLETLLAVVRQRAEKLAHYIEIARGYESASDAAAGSTVVKLRTRKRAPGPGASALDPTDEG